MERQSGLNNMKRTGIIFAALVLCILTLSGCFGGGGSGSGGSGPDNIIGPRTEEAWKKWDQQQADLREKWKDTEIYAYVRTLMEDMEQVNAYVVFQDGFSVEEESKELDALLKLYSDMNFSEEIPPEEFIRILENSELRFAFSSMLDLDSIKERKEEDGGGYDVTILYYPTPDSLMPVDVRITTDDGGKFTVEETFQQDQEK